jgi:hypothetical protein
MLGRELGPQDSGSLTSEGCIHTAATFGALGLQFSQAAVFTDGSTIMGTCVWPITVAGIALVKTLHGEPYFKAALCLASRLSGISFEIEVEQPCPLAYALCTSW